MSRGNADAPRGGGTGANGNDERGANGNGTRGASGNGARGASGNGTRGASGNGSRAKGSRARAPGHIAITGAAGAIGAALARAMRAAWPTAALALIDRDPGPLERLAAELGGTPATGSSATAAELGGTRATGSGRSAVAELGGTRATASTASGSAVAELGGTRATASTASGSAATSPGPATVHVADLCELDALPALVDAIEADGPLDGLVNCAGVMKVQHLSTWRWEDAHALVTIDLLAPLRLQDLLARRMVERGRGLIVNVASMAGRVPLRGAAYYGASKAGLAMASEIARADLAPHGVQVVTVYPGPVKSALEAGARADYGGGGLFGRLAPTGDPAELARRIMHAIAEDEPRVIYPRAYSIGWTAPNLSSWIALSYGPPPVG